MKTRTKEVTNKMKNKNIVATVNLSIDGLKINLVNNKNKKIIATVILTKNGLKINW